MSRESQGAGSTSFFSLLPWKDCISTKLSQQEPPQHFWTIHVQRSQMRGKLIFSSARARVTQGDPALSMNQELSHRLSHWLLVCCPKLWWWNMWLGRKGKGTLRTDWMVWVGFCIWAPLAVLSKCLSCTALSVGSVSAGPGLYTSKEEGNEGGKLGVGNRGSKSIRSQLLGCTNHSWAFPSCLVTYQNDPDII